MYLNSKKWSIISLEKYFVIKFQQVDYIFPVEY